MKKETASSYETLVNICQIIIRRIPEDINIPSDHHENNKSLDYMRRAEYFDLMGE
jgi:hypothetical protein